LSTVIRKGDVTLNSLLRALECARSRLAVAMAAESKLTPRERWRSYIEIEDRMRRCLRMLRSQQRTSAQETALWLPALEALQRISSVEETRQRRSEAQHLCRFLDEVLARIESHGRLQSDLGSLSK
jgi:chromatin segregation and condensation protein Rec8/ScpA/Scc1 (kleisin family)